MNEFASAAPRQTGNTHKVPRGTGELGMWIFLASLAMLFAGGAVGYVVIRLQLNANRAEAIPPLPPLPSVDLPPLLWISTAAILLSSITLHLALGAIRAKKMGAFSRHLRFSTIFALAFLVTQAPCLMVMLSDHWEGIAETGPLGGEHNGLVFSLVLIHALHLVGGLWPLWKVIVGARKDRYTPQEHDGVRFLAMYWHFLDVVWIILFATLLLTP